MQNSSSCILLQSGHFLSKEFTAFRVQEKSIVEPKPDGKMFNTMQSTQCQEKAQMQLFGDKDEAAGGKQ